MSILANIKRGQIARPQRIVLYAVEGIGKSTIASQMPAPLFFDFEHGTHHLDCARLTPANLEEVELAIDELIGSGPDKSGFQTVVFDTVDWMVKLIIDDMISREKGKASIEDWGYGKGYVILAEKVTGLLARFDGLIHAGYHVLCLAHAEVKKFEAPDDTAGYDRYQLKIERKAEPLIKEWADALLFGNYRTILRETESGKVKGVKAKERRIYTTRDAAWDAKNRHGLEDVEPWDIETLRRIISSNDAEPTTPAAAANPEPASKPAAAGKRRDQEPDADTIPGVSEDDADLRRLDEICKPHVEIINAYLVDRGEIEQGAGYRAMSPEFRARVLSKPAQFLKAVIKAKANVAQ